MLTLGFARKPYSVLVSAPTLYHQHNPAFGFDEGFGVVHNDGVNLCRGYGLVVLADVQPSAVYNVCNLLCPQSAVVLDKDV